MISGIPMVTMPLAFQRAIIEQSFAALGPGGCLLQYTYSPISPIPAKKLGVEARLVRFVVRNLPPGDGLALPAARRQGVVHQWPGQRPRLTCPGDFPIRGRRPSGGPSSADLDGRPRAAGPDP